MFTPSPLNSLNLFDSSPQDDATEENEPVRSFWENLNIQAPCFKDAKMRLEDTTRLKWAVQYKSKEKFVDEKGQTLNKYRVLQCTSHISCSARVYNLASPKIQHINFILS